MSFNFNSIIFLSLSQIKICNSIWILYFLEINKNLSISFFLTLINLELWQSLIINHYLSYHFSGLLASKPEASVPEADVISQDNVEAVEGFKSKIDGIRDVLARDHMKVVFFGRWVVKWQSNSGVMNVIMINSNTTFKWMLNQRKLLKRFWDFDL